MDSDSQTENGRGARPQKSRGRVILFDAWCKGCGLCIEFCPRGVFEANGQGKPMVVRPERCTACHWCDTHCPDMAITVQRLEPEEVKELEELAGLAAQGAMPGGDL